MSKGNGGSISVINPSGASLVVTITRGTATPTAYTTAALSAEHTMPLTITDDETFWFEAAGQYTVSVTQGGAEIANGTGGTKTIPLVGGCGVGFTPSGQFGASSADLTALDADNLVTGTVDTDRLPPIYEVATPGFLTQGSAPGFGVDEATIVADGFIQWGKFFPFDDDTQLGTVLAVDDEWCTWTPDTTTILIKQTGFYHVRTKFYPTEIPADTWRLSIYTGYTDVDLDKFVPGAFAGSDTQPYIRLSGVVPIDAGNSVKLRVREGTNLVADVTPTSATLSITPVWVFDA